MSSTSATRHTSAADSSAAVDQLMAALQHPHKDLIEALRLLILNVHPDVREGVKWNAPSWRTSEYFATTHLRAKQGVGLILHLGAKARQLPAGGVRIDDPDSALNWLAPDRAMLTFKDLTNLQDRSRCLVTLLRQWIDYV